MKFLIPLGAAIALVVAACNNVGSCPSTITPGASCSGDNLECPYTIQTTSSACSSIAVDGAVATSCTCMGGVWSCPSCGDDGGASEAGTDATMEDGGDGSVEAGPEGSLPEAGPDSTTPEAGNDSGHEASVEASTDGPVESSSSMDSSTDGAHD